MALRLRYHLCHSSSHISNQYIITYVIFPPLFYQASVSEEKKLLTSRSPSLPAANSVGNKVIKIQAEGANEGCKRDNPGSPIIDVEGMSSEEDEDKVEGDEVKVEAEVGGQTEDQRVLSLAEQFIAAMPARIKNQEASNLHLIDNNDTYAGD